MSRLASLSLMTAFVAALTVAASADAGNKRHSINFAGSQITLPGGPGFQPPGLKPPVLPPIKPPVICPKPPIFPPIHPPIVCPKPPIVLPPAPPVVVCPPKPPVILPPPVVCEKPPVVCPPTHVGYRFGMHLQRVQTQYGVGLQVVSVDHGSPAWHARLQPGHVLMAANNQSLAHAASNEHGVALLHAAVNAGQPVATAAPAVTLVSTASTPAAPTVALSVLNPTTNQMRAFYVTPEIVGAAAPAVGAPVALNPAEATATL